MAKTFRAWSAERGEYLVTPAEVTASYARQPTAFVPSVPVTGPAMQAIPPMPAGAMAGLRDMPLAQAGLLPTAPAAGQETKEISLFEELWGTAMERFGQTPAGPVGPPGPPGPPGLGVLEAGVEGGPQIATAGIGLGIGALATVVPTALAWLGGKGILPYLVKMGLAGGIASTAWNTIRTMFGLNPDEAIAAVKRKGKRRYSIGTNPRVGTLIKVTKRVTSLMEKYDKQLSKIRPKTRTKYVGGGPKYLSSVEKAALKAGG